MGEIIFHILFMIFTGILYFEASGINVTRASDPIGAAGFPKGILVLMFLLLIVSLIRVIQKYKKNKIETTFKELNIVWIGILVSVSMYTLVLDKLGFILSSLFLLIVLFYILGLKKISYNLVLSFLTTFGFTMLFGRILSLPLPRGIELLRDLSYYIY